MKTQDQTKTAMEKTMAFKCPKCGTNRTVRKHSRGILGGLLLTCNKCKIQTEWLVSTVLSHRMAKGE